MSLLTDTDIRAILAPADKNWADKDKLYIYPFEENSLTPIGYDLRVGSPYASSIDGQLFDLKPDNSIVIIPGDTLLITTLEDVGMPKNRKYSAFITSKVSKVAKGLSHISTNIDPDWEGRLLIALHNPSKNTVFLKYSETFCTINFIENKSPSTKNCGKERGRTDILIQQFVKSTSEFRAKEIKKERGNLILKGLICIVFAGFGYFAFKSTSGFIATTALGVALANIFNINKLTMKRH